MTLVVDVPGDVRRFRGKPFVATISRTFESELGTWTRIAQDGSGLAFRHPDALRAWEATIGRRPTLEPLAVTIYDGSGMPVMGLPLIRERRGLSRIGFADGGVVDYNAPIVARDVAFEAADAHRLRQALLAALPRTDVLRLERMPRRLGTHLNPLATGPQVRPSTDVGLTLDLPDGYAAWRQALPRRFRMELGRCARLFDASPGARFERVSGDGAPVFDVLERLQRERFVALGTSYDLDTGDIAAFYRRLAADLDAGPGVLTALRTQDGVVAALFGLRQGSRYIMLRIAADPAQAQISPGRLLITATMEHLRAEGVTHFDFGRGDYAYKRKLGAQPLDLCDLVMARSVRGLGEAAAFRIKARVRANPGLLRPLRRLHVALGGKGTPPS